MTDHPRDRHLAVVDTDDDPPGPPSDLAAERATLGAMLVSRRIIDDVANTVTGPEFYRPGHELIYDAILALHLEGEPADAITVADRLTATGSLKRAGGAAYLHDLVNATPIADSGPYYAQIVAEKAAQRRLAEVAARIQQLAYQGASDDLPALYAAAGAALEGAAKWLPAADDTTNTWAPVDIAQILASNEKGPTATILTRRDGKALLYPHAVHSVAGEPGSGKTWVALVAVAQELEQGHPALFIDFEDRAATVVGRLRQLGVTDQAIAGGLRYIRPDTALDTNGWRALELAAAGATIAIIDGITEAMAIHGLAINENDDVAKWLHLIPNRLADLGPAVLQIDHVTKNADTRGRYAIGAQHKLAGITGVAYKMLTVKSLGRGAKGQAKLLIDKDKHGDVGPNGLTAADLHHDATDPSGQIYAWLDTPGIDIDDDGHFRPTTLMQRVSDYLASHGGSTSNAIKGGVRGKGESIADAIDALIREGHIRTEPAPRGGAFHHLVTPFEDRP